MRATGLEIVVERNFPQRNHDTMILQQTNFRLQVPATALKLVRRGLISWRGTSYGCADITVCQSQAIYSGLRFGLIGESIAIQRLIQPISAPITGKDTSRPISTVCCGRQTQDIESRLVISKSWHGTPPVDPSPVLLPFLSCNRLSIHDQARTGRAIGDNLVQTCQSSHRGSQCTMKENSILLAGNSGS